MDKRAKKGFFYGPAFPLKNRLALTTGDSDGLGKFVALQALKKLGPKKNFQFLIWTGQEARPIQIPGFKSLVFSEVSSALKSDFKENHLIHILSPGSPVLQLEEAARLCLRKKVSALVTGPMSKKQFLKSKKNVISQTGLLKKICHKEDVFMSFRGKHFNLILWSDHIPLKNISIERQAFKSFLEKALLWRKFLPKALQKKPLGVLGLNPHAGEGALIGKEEKNILEPLLNEFSPKEVQGPLCPDSAFLKKHWGLYSFFIALYHDQGLIPFKMIHPAKGFVQVLGLPFFRLGVDHGTGKGLKTKEISSDSFLLALKESLRLIRRQIY